MRFVVKMDMKDEYNREKHLIKNPHTQNLQK